MSAREDNIKGSTNTATSRQEALSSSPSSPSSHWQSRPNNVVSQLASIAFYLPLSFITYVYSKILTFVGRPPAAPFTPRIRVTTTEQDEILETVPIMQRELEQEMRVASVEQEKISQDMNNLKSRLARLEERRRQRKIKVDRLKRD
eukprot:278181_1